MEQLKEEEITTVLALVRARLRHEARRPSRIGIDGTDIQALRVWQLSELVEKLERIKLAL